ncbi:MAG: hypothetical protein ACO2ZM_00395 [Francisellaceae bacterium]
MNKVKKTIALLSLALPFSAFAANGFFTINNNTDNDWVVYSISNAYDFKIHCLTPVPESYQVLPSPDFATEKMPSISGGTVGVNYFNVPAYSAVQYQLSSQCTNGVYDTLGYTSTKIWNAWLGGDVEARSNGGVIFQLQYDSEAQTASYGLQSFNSGLLIYQSTYNNAGNVLLFMDILNRK